MAKSDSPAAPPRRGRVTRYYTPPTDIRMAPTCCDGPVDCYTGTQDELVAAGLLPRELFPGEPGMPLGSVVLRPPDTPFGVGWNFPGRMRVIRLFSGKFTATVVVSADEQLRRREAAQREKEERLRPCADRSAERKALEQTHARRVTPEEAARSTLDLFIREHGLDFVRKHVESHRQKVAPLAADNYLERSATTILSD